MKDERKPTVSDTFFMYGSLRRGMYNHYILEDKSKFIANAKLTGYKLISFGTFPAIIPSENGIVVGELFKITDDETIKTIDFMEVGHGYKRTFKIIKDVFGHEHEVIFYEKKYPERYQDIEVVESGDWVKFKGEV